MPDNSNLETEKPQILCNSEAATWVHPLSASLLPHNLFSTLLVPVKVIVFYLSCTISDLYFADLCLNFILLDCSIIHGNLLMRIYMYNCKYKYYNTIKIDPANNAN